MTDWICYSRALERRCLVGFCWLWFEFSTILLINQPSQFCQFLICPHGQSKAAFPGFHLMRSICLRELSYMTATIFDPLPLCPHNLCAVCPQTWGILWPPLPLLSGRHIWKPLRIMASFVCIACTRAAERLKCHFVSDLVGSQSRPVHRRHLGAVLEGHDLQGEKYSFEV